MGVLVGGGGLKKSEKQIRNMRVNALHYALWIKRLHGLSHGWCQGCHSCFSFCGDLPVAIAAAAAATITDDFEWQQVTDKKKHYHKNALQFLQDDIEHLSSFTRCST